MENCSWPEADGNNAFMFPWVPPGEADVAALQYHGCNPAAVGPPPWVAEDRNCSASRSHSEAEKRRRERINAQLATLRKLIPKSEKMDKAALLGHVVDHVKEQRERAKEATKFSTLIPTETDEVIVDHFNADEEVETTTSSQAADRNIYVKASICCDDRPELFAELNSALKGLGLTIAQAEITSLGGRMKSNFILCAGATEPNSRAGSVRQSLKLALSRVVIASGSSSYSARSKRQRFFYTGPC